MLTLVLYVCYQLGRYIFNRYYAREASEPSRSVAVRIADRQQIFVYNNTQFAISDRPYRPSVEFIQTVSFSPPTYVQRYLAVMRVLSDLKYDQRLQKVVEFECDQLDFFSYLKNLRGVEKIVLIDSKKETLIRNKTKVMPQVTDFLQKRERPLQVELLAGTMPQRDKRLERTDAVVCMESLVYLPNHVLLAMPRYLLEYIQPKVAIITIPNAEFNRFLPRPSQFRQPDYQFEWSRREFENWARRVVRRHPNYTVTFQGIGYGPEGTEDVGPCTQMAIFERKERPLSYIEGNEESFEAIETITYPFSKNNSTDLQKVIDEAKSCINFFEDANEELPNEVSLIEVHAMMTTFSISLETLRSIISASGYTVEDREGGPVIILSNDETDSDELSENGLNLNQVADEMLSETSEDSDIDIDIAPHLDINHNVYEYWNDDAEEDD